MTLALPLLLALVQSPSLEESVAAYWDLLSQGDKAAALDFVTPEARNHFIRRREPVIREWKLLAIEHQDSGTAVVSVRIQRVVPGMPDAVPLTVKEKWLFQGGAWQVATVKPDKRMLEARFNRPAKAPGVALDGTVSLNPEVLKIHFLDRRQTGMVRLANGFRFSPLEVTTVEYDRDRFELIARPESIASGELGAFQLRYKGEETAKELTSEVTLVLRAVELEIRLTVPVLYNHLSAGTRALFGLSDEAAQKLRRDSRLAPVLNKP